MQNNVNTSVEVIIAKIDNDFNPDHSDWIPRVGAWCYEAMGIIDVLPKERITKKLKVHDRIAYSPCNIGNSKLKVYDCNGCEIEEAKDKSIGCNCSSTGDLERKEVISTSKVTPTTIDNYNNPSAESNSTYVKADLINTKEWPGRYNVIGYNSHSNKKDNNYVVIDNNKIELNFDTNCITIEYEGIKTEYSKIFDCELPVIPNNQLLIEAITYFCMYKMLCRGYKHPVFNLAASQYGTNPYYIWNTMKDEAARSVIIDGIDKDITKIMRSAMFIDIFDSRR